MIIRFIGSHKVGLVFEGREHSGIEDARNTARLVRPIHILANPLFFSSRFGKWSVTDVFLSRPVEPKLNEKSFNTNWHTGIHQPKQK